MHASTQGQFPAGVRRLLTSSLCILKYPTEVRLLTAYTQLLALILSTSQPMRFESQPCGEVTN